MFFTGDTEAYLGSSIALSSISRPRVVIKKDVEVHIEDVSLLIPS